MKKIRKYGHAAGGKAAGVITVFFTLLLTVFLALFFALVESARVQGARSQAANVTDLANCSLFSEYEKQLLSDYELFAVDAAYGGSRFSLSQMNRRFETFLSWNAYPSAGFAVPFCFDPWQLDLEKGKITKYALLTDPGGAGFYEQAVAFMKETALSGAVGKLYAFYTDARKLETLQETYEQEQDRSDADMETAQQSAQEAIEQARKEGRKLKRPENLKNPVREVAGVIRSGIFRNVVDPATVSNVSVSGFSLVSHRIRQRGNLYLEEQYGSLTDDLFFREYLLDRFPNYREPQNTSGNGTVLAYQTEYLIAGKKSDLQNLKSIALRLVLLREGANYLYSTQDAVMGSAAGSMALLLMGWTGMPAIVETTRQALLLAWSYGESLLDVKTLFSGGRVPLMKTQQTWRLSLEDLANLSQILSGECPENGEGLYYRDYLRILLNLQGTSEQEKRGLDLIEMNLRYGCGLSSFRADHCIVAVKDETFWKIPPVFLRITGAFSGIVSAAWNTAVQAGFSYQS